MPDPPPSDPIRLPSKHHPATHPASPRTVESTRLKLSTLFSFVSSTPPPRQPQTTKGKARQISSPSPLKQSASSRTLPAHEGTPRRPPNGGTSTGLWSWLSPRSSVGVSQGGEGNVESESEGEAEGEWDEGCFVDALSLRSASSSAKRMERKEQRSLLDLPDELIIQILAHLPPSPAELLALGQTCSHIHALAQTPSLWLRLYASHPRWSLPSALPATEATTVSPWRFANGSYVWNTCTPSDLARARAVEVHYPTLYRSRWELSRQIRESQSSTPHTFPRICTEEVAGHEDTVYTLSLFGEYMVTGSRDRSIRVWKLGAVPMDGTEPARAECVAVVPGDGVDGHTGSVLSLDIKPYNGQDPETDAGALARATMVSGSSDGTARVWTVSFGGETVDVKLRGVLRGHTGGVLDVKVSEDRIATCSKDSTMRIYDRSSLALGHVLTPHLGPVNALALHPDPAVPLLASASGDGSFLIHHLHTGRLVARSHASQQGRGMACVIWEHDGIFTGDNDRLLRRWSLADPAKEEQPGQWKVANEWKGHAELVRCVSLWKEERRILSGGYDRTVRMWGLEGGGALAQGREMDAVGDGLVFDVKMRGCRMFTASHDGLVRITTFGVGLPYLGMFA